MINITEEKLKAAIQIIVSFKGVYTEELENDLVFGIKALSICEVSRSKQKEEKQFLESEIMNANSTVELIKDLKSNEFNELTGLTYFDNIRNGLITKFLYMKTFEKIKVGDRVFAYDIDGTKQYGILQRGDTFLGENTLYVDYEDGESCVVLDESTLFKAESSF